MKSLTEYPDGDLILMCAYRYACGRSTYIVSTMVDTIINEWPNLPHNMKKQINKEIQQAIDHGSAGMEMDKRQWQKILELW